MARPHTLRLRLVLLAAIVALICLIGSYSSFLFYERVSLRSTIARDLKLQGEILASGVEGDLEQGLSAASMRIVNSFQANKRLRAVVYDAKGAVLAVCPKESSGLPAMPKGENLVIQDDGFTVFKPIMHNGRFQGMAMVQSDPATYELHFYGLCFILLFLTAVLCGVLYLVVSRVIRWITKPVNTLAEAAQKIGENGDYTQRLDRPVKGELATFVDAYNGLLEQILQRDTQLRQAKDELEAQVTQRSDQLLRVNTQLLLAKEKAEESSRAKSAFLANMSHELRTPLNAILLYSELVGDDLGELGMPDTVADVQKIRSAGKHLLSLIDEILDLSKIEAGRMTPYLEICDIPSVIRDVAAMAEPVVQKNHNTFRAEVDPRVTSILTDVKMVRQTLFNLLSNAAKFTQNGEVVLNVEPDPDEKFVRFIVRDTGIGMSEEQTGRIFQEFTQADDSTTRRFGGTGLGLSLSRRFTELLGGTIEVVSSPGKGSTFTVRIPRSSTTPARSAALPKPVPQHSSLHRGKILIIDDDPALREAVSRMLTKDGFWVAMASSGEEGIQMARALKPQVITLDIAMPGMDGWQVLSALKSDAELKDIPVILLTMLDGRTQGYALGATAVLQKPISREELLAVIDSIEIGTIEAPLLVVEDDPATSEAMGRILMDAGWEVRKAMNGEQALELIQIERPQAILLDLMLPEMDGFQLLAQLQQHPQWRKIPVIVLTAKDLTPEDLQRLQVDQVHHVFRKGACTKEELAEATRSITLNWLKPSGDAS